MPVLSQFRMRVGLQRDNICARPIFHTIHLHVDASRPVGPFNVFLAIDIDVRSAKSVSNLIFFLGVGAFALAEYSAGTLSDGAHV